MELLPDNDINDDWFSTAICAAVYLFMVVVLTLFVGSIVVIAASC